MSKGSEKIGLQNLKFNKLQTKGILEIRTRIGAQNSQLTSCEIWIIEIIFLN